MTQPKFAVGEVVILQSISQPQLNGEYTVLSATQEGDLARCPLSGQVILNGGPGLSYILDDGYSDASGICALWNEAALRKRHQPGEYNWQDLKTILHLPVSRTELARLDQEVAHA